MPPRLLLSLLYFAHVGGMGAWLPFLALHLDRSGVSGAGIGGLLATIPVARMIAAPLWAAVADRFKSGRLLLVVASSMSVASVACVALLPLTPWQIGLALVGFSAFRAPIAPLLDTSAVRLLVEEGADPRDYGRVRLWGTVGFIVLTSTGAMLVAASPSATGALLLALGAWTVAAVLALLLPPTQSAAPAPVLPALRKLAASPFLAPLLLALCLHGFGLSLYDTTLAMHLEARGMQGAWVAAALSCGLAAEVVVMFFGRRLLGAVGPFKLLTMAGAGGVLRWGLTAVITVPVVLVALQILHGLVFAVFWIAGVEAMRRHAPPEVRVSAQALLTTSTYGVGSLLSSLAIGSLLDGVGTPGLYAMAAVLSALATVGLWAAQRRAPV